MERQRASDFDPQVLKLFDQLVHGGISRREFLDRAAPFAAGGATAATLFVFRRREPHAAHRPVGWAAFSSKKQSRQSEGMGPIQPVVLLSSVSRFSANPYRLLTESGRLSEDAPDTGQSKDGFG